MSVFLTKIQFSNVVQCRSGSQGAVSSATDSYWSFLGVHRVKPLKDFGLFTSVGQKIA